MTMTLKNRILSALGTAMFAVLMACGGGGGTSSQPMGTLRVALTDAPACGFDAVNVTIQKLRVHQSASAVDADPGWSEIVLAPVQRVNLLNLQNGVLAELGQTPLPAGKYTQLRVVLGANDSAAPLANSVLPTGGVETALTTPSAQQTGLKMNVDLDVGANQMLDLVLDFNACKSVVKAGNSGKYLLKPVISVVPRFVSGAAGVVDASLANGNTMVSLQQSGLVVKATSPSSTGGFLLQPVSPGTYDLVITAPGLATLVVTDVVVASGLVTTVNSASTVFPLTASASGTAAGMITTGVLPVDGTVNVLQTLSGGR